VAQFLLVFLQVDSVIHNGSVTYPFLKKKGAVMATTKDPVCNMKVQSEQVADQTEHKGQKYYFCSSECKQEFEKSPDRYTKNKKEKPSK
jgi:YHS domain-containing protein